jgi:hypothetical protein
MDYSFTEPIYEHGRVPGVFYGQDDRVEELNKRLVSRQYPDKPLPPNYDPRPVPTKYSRFPIIDRKAPIKERLHNYDLDDSSFYPTSTNGPPNTFLKNVDTETFLRNQTVALQHGASMGVYVPSSQSDLYKASVPASSLPMIQPHPQLFERNNSFSQPSGSYVLENQAVGRDVFTNYTRTQLRNTINN